MMDAPAVLQGHIYRVDAANRRFDLLTETLFDSVTRESRTRHPARWTEHTRFVRVIRQNSFAGLESAGPAIFRDLDAENSAAARSGKPFTALRVLLLAEGEEREIFRQDDSNYLAAFRPDPSSEAQRGGWTRFGENDVPVRLRGPRAEVEIHRKTTADALLQGFWKARVWGARDADGVWAASRMDIEALPDPRATDDPRLPRVLVIGDSISMNYHEAAKRALRGVANYRRIEENGGPSDRGVACAELWLGDYTQPGLQWDLIQFNHGLHDLKQAYDEATGEYGAHQVPVEEYQANLERLIAILRQTGARLMWCSTTPVPNDSHGRLGNVVFGRRKDEDLVYNRAALEVMRRHPDILVNDLNAFVRASPEFDEWRNQSDVHFWDSRLQETVGRAVARAIARALSGNSRGASAPGDERCVKKIG